ncbi:MAG: RNA polymerase sigma-70 factor [Crocinitomicaceae bacterium]
MTRSEFQSLFNQLYSPLCNYANAILNDFDKSEDTVQDVLYSFWEKRKTLKIDADKYENYLIRSVKFKCIDLHRQKKVVRKYETEVLHTSSFIETEDNDAPDYRAILFKAISELPEKTRVVFMMSKIDGLKYQEIADDLNISPKTVENQMGRAFKHLRSIIKNEQLFNFLLLYLFIR